MRLIEENNSSKKPSPKLKKIVGALKLPKNFDEKKALKSYFDDKQFVKKII